MITTTSKLEIIALTAEILAVDSGAGIVGIGDLETTDSKAVGLDSDDMSVYSRRLVIDNSSLTNAQLQTIVDAHNYTTSKTARKLDDIRIERNTRLANCDYVVMRHRDQVAAGDTTTITAAKYQEWLAYRQNLRNFPSTCDPDSPSWPTEPS